MAKPTRYFVQWDATVDPDVDALDIRTEDVIGGLAGALALARGISREQGVCVQVVERTNIHDVTPHGDPSGLLWDWDEDWANAQDVWEG